MPIAPRDPFFKFTCHKCGWSDVTYQASDVIHRPQVCPTCGERQFVFSKASALESIMALPKKFISKILNKR
jgi:ribosomal protein S27E